MSRGYRPLIGPLLLSLLGFLAYALAAPVTAWLRLDPEGMAASVLRDGTGAGAWLALAWAGARLLALLLQGHPRLLTDLLTAALFAATVVAILLLVFEWPATGLIATSSVTIAVVGFALRNIIGDVFSGIALGVERPYRDGDWIEAADGYTGRVVEVNWRATRLRSREGITHIVPNGLIAGRRLTNYGASETGPGGGPGNGGGGGSYRTSLRVPIDAAVPVDRARRILLGAALDAARQFPDLAPIVQLTEFVDGAAMYRVVFMVPDYGREVPCRDAVATAVLRALQQAGLGLPRRDVDVHLARPDPAMARPRRETLLRNVELFRPFEGGEFAELAAHMAPRTLRQGERLMRQGEEGQSLYILAEGVLDILVSRDGGEAVAIDRHVPGAVLGEMSLLTGQPRSATVVAVTDAVVYEVRREHLDPILRRRPEIGDGLATIMAERQARLHRHSQVPEEQRPAPPSREDLLGRLRAFFHLR
ncbi:mechanosensitive ion channel [Roseomonas sp. NAR14]|uniref:Small-conductance mechanosensitive channel n=1 Tax=Roseomonas acroporae TaxID=2937791 RepID=A0A9X1Y951_9PROT|nr:cyclic nucleotide-binding domain-containing protein [Roseomonas acroporae]MCK8785721.1 mechanosensitive ion channel [Roseomonas acroporae]